jgi:hypothetical protein
VFAWLPEEDGDVATLLERHGVKVASGEDTLRPLVRAVLAEHATAVAQVLAGEERPFGFLVGQVMKKSGGQAVPQEVQRPAARGAGRRALRRRPGSYRDPDSRRSAARCARRWWRRKARRSRRCFRRRSSRAGRGRAEDLDARLAQALAR